MNFFGCTMPTRMLAATVLTAAALAGCGSGSSGSSTLPSSPQAAGGPGAQSASVTSGTNKSAASMKKRASAATGYAAVVLADQPLAYYQLNDATSALADSGPNSIGGIYGSGVTLQAPMITQGGS